MRKKALLALMLAAVMLLSGCALITVDEEVDNARTVIDVNGEIVTKGQLDNLVQNQVYQNQQMNSYYSLLGLASYLPSTAADVVDDVAQSQIEGMVARQKATDMGFYTMTDEENEEIQNTAQENYDAVLDEIALYYYPDSELEEDALRAECETFAQENGFASLEDYVKTATDNKAVEKLRADTVKDVAVTEDELASGLSERAESEKTTYENSLITYGYNVNNGTTVYYNPAGYRYVKQILIQFTEEDNTAVTDALSALTAAQNALTTAQSNLDNAAEDADMEALQAAVDQAKADEDAAQTAADDAMATAYANIQEKTDEVYAAATAEDADFDALVKEYNEDTGMPETGYAVCEGYTYFVTSFTEAAMALENVGDVSEPVKSDYGYHIIQYSADIPEGSATVDDVRETLTAELLTAKQDEAYAAALDGWVAEASVTTYLDRMGY